MKKSPSRRRSSEEIFPLVKAYRSGEMNRSDFCKAYIVSLSALNYWKSKYLRSVNRPSSSGLTPLKLAVGPREFALEVQLNNGSRPYSYPPVSYLKELGS